MYDYSPDFVFRLIRRNIKLGKFVTDKVKISKKLKRLRTKLNLPQQTIYIIFVNLIIYQWIELLLEQKSMKLFSF